MASSTQQVFKHNKATKSVFSSQLQPPVEHGYARVREGLLNQWKEIYEDQTLKDVEITLCDGEKIMADSLVLKLSSPVFKAMLTHQMLEGQTMTLHIEDCPGAGFRFFLRLLYTGQMEPNEWPNEEATEQHEPQSTNRHQPQPRPQGLFETAPQGAFGISIGSAGVVRHGGLFGPTPPLPQELPREMQTPQGPPQGNAGLFGPTPPLPQVPPDYPQDLTQGAWGAFGPAPPLPAAVVGPSGNSPPVPPIDILLAAAALAKKYQVDWLLAVLVDVLKRRITEQSFERILAASMRLDLAPVRLCTLDFAKANAVVRSRYDASDFLPEVMFELQAVFPIRTHSSPNLSI